MNFGIILILFKVQAAQAKPAAVQQKAKHVQVTSTCSSHCTVVRNRAPGVTQELQQGQLATPSGSPCDVGVPRTAAALMQIHQQVLVPSLSSTGQHVTPTFIDHAPFITLHTFKDLERGVDLVVQILRHLHVATLRNAPPELPEIHMILEFRAQPTHARHVPRLGGVVPNVTGVRE